MNVRYRITDVVVKVCSQSLATNALKRLMDQLEERSLQTDQLKNASKRLQHRVDHTQCESYISSIVYFVYIVHI